MKERTPQDKAWIEDKTEAARINHLILDKCWYKGKFYRQIVPLKTILKYIRRDKREVNQDEFGV